MVDNRLGQRVKYRNRTQAQRRGLPGYVLGTDVADGYRVPQIISGWSDQVFDFIAIAMLDGQVPAHFAAAAESLAHSFRVPECRVMENSNPGEVILALRRNDPLADILEAPPMPAATDVRKVHVGTLESGQAYTIRIAGNMILAGGSSGSGKSGLMWMIVRGLLPAARDGLVKLHAADGKGFELGLGMPIWSRYGSYSSTPEEIADMLECQVEEMRKRAARYRGVRRDHIPTEEEPLHVIIVDEIGAVCSYIGTTGTKGTQARIKASLQTIASLGRATGWVVIGNLQDVRKSVLDFRDLFITRIGLRLDGGPQIVDLLMGDGVRDMGAYCDIIPVTAPGIGYVFNEGSRTPQKVRFYWVDDGEIQRMCETL